MNIGLNAFLAITDNLERKEGPPHMPGSSVNLPSRKLNRVRMVGQYWNGNCKNYLKLGYRITNAERLLDRG